ncbi:MAG TPA: hypothetical protein VFM88_01370 [Vicinamibacteria bacterium]|nr:hypothetical protein [Vicinamibacteria bacterium]
MKRSVAVLGFSALLLAGARPAAAQAKPWLHIQVEEAKGSKVHVNVPLSLVEIALKAAPEPILDEKHIRLGKHCGRLSVSDARKMWLELKAAGDTDFVTMRDEDEEETVTVSRKGELVQVRVEGAHESERVMVDVPIALVDALFAGEGEELNLQGAIRELSKRRGDVVRVEDRDDRVRIWIDEGR